MSQELLLGLIIGWVIIDVIKGVIFMKKMATKDFAERAAEQTALGFMLDHNRKFHAYPKPKIAFKVRESETNKKPREKKTRAKK